MRQYKLYIDILLIFTYIQNINIIITITYFLFIYLIYFLKIDYIIKQANLLNLFLVSIIIDDDTV